METLWINVEYIVRLIKRFTLQVSKMIPEAIPMLRMVVPVTNADALLEDTEILVNTFDATAGTGWKVAYTVPDSDRIEVLTMDINRTTGVTAEVQDMGAYDGADTAKFHSWTASNTNTHMFVQPIPFERNWEMRFYVSTANLGDIFTVRCIIRRQKSWSTP